MVLAAYATGLPAVVLIRSAVASFYSREDTTTPLVASLSGVAVNVLAKLAFTTQLGVAGLALGTAIGAWVNFVLLVVLARRRGWMIANPVLGRGLAAVGMAAAGLALVAVFLPPHLRPFTATLPAWRDETLLGLVAAAGAVIYAILLILGLRLVKVRLARR
jgi:putative peptidoglycan lipid II flippase